MWPSLQNCPEIRKDLATAPGDKEFRPFLAFAYLRGVRLRAWLLWPSRQNCPEIRKDLAYSSPEIRNSGFLAVVCYIPGSKTEGLAFVAKPSKLPGDKEGLGLELPGDKEFRPFLAFAYLRGVRPGDKEGPGLELPGDKEFRPFLAFAYLRGVKLRAWLLWPSLQNCPEIRKDLA